MNALKHESLVLPENLPDISEPVSAWNPSSAEARLDPKLLYKPYTDMFLFVGPFPVKKVVDIGKLGYMWTSNNKTSVSGELTTSSVSLGPFGQVV